MKKFLISIYFVSILFSIPQLDAQISMTAIKEHFQNHKYKYFIAAAGVKLLGLLYLSNCGKKSKKQRTGRSSEVSNDLAKSRNLAAGDAASNCGGGGGAAAVNEADPDEGTVMEGTIEKRELCYWFISNDKEFHIRNAVDIEQQINAVGNQTIRARIKNITNNNLISFKSATIEILSPYKFGSAK